VNPAALAEAAASQKLRRRGQLTGPLHGVPVIVKITLPALGCP
jgi:Asp-tRNA(Asn)/Glu-tRNA(Gln) amidotransferase A subunit family amidase